MLNLYDFFLSNKFKFFIVGSILTCSALSTYLLATKGKSRPANSPTGKEETPFIDVYDEYEEPYYDYPLKDEGE